MAKHSAPTRVNGFYRRLLLLSILAAAIFLPGAAYAQSVDPASLTYRLRTGDSLTLYFTLTTPAPLAGVAFGNNGLVNDDQTANIPPDKIVIAPENVAALEGQQRFAVTIQQPAQPGHFTGDLTIHYKGQPADRALTVALDVTVLPEPRVAASAASPNQVLRLQPNFFYLGDCTVAPAPLPAGGQIVVTLEQGGTGVAALLDVKLDPLRATAQSLPASVLSISPIVTPTRPLTTTVGTIDLTVAPAAPPCIPPGEYTGGLRALVAGQDDPVVVPFKVQSKVGLLWPLLVAALGILAGAFSYYLNQKVNPLAKAIQKTEGIQALLTNPQWLLADEIETFAGAVKEIQDSMMGGEEPPKVEAALDALLARIKTAQEANRKFVTDEVGPIRSALDTLTVGEKAAGAVKSTLGEVENRVKAGAYGNLALARKDLAVAGEREQKLQEIAERFAGVKRKADAEAVPQVDIEKLQADLNLAEDIAGLNALIGEAEAKYALPPPAGAGAPASARSAEPFTAAKPVFETFAASLKVQRWIGVSLTALFALAGGLVALYVPNATWGAKIEDYITLAVWALSVNIIAGQSFDFKAQLKPTV